MQDVLDVSQKLLIGAGALVVGLRLSQLAKRRRSAREIGTVKALYNYPVKSLRAITGSQEMPIDAFGPVFDRRFVVVDAESMNFVTQRQEPQMSLITVKWDDKSGTLNFSAPKMPAIAVPIVTEARGGGPGPTVTVWGEEAGAFDQGDEIAKWLSESIGRKVRLMHFNRERLREIEHKYQSPDPNANRNVAFADGFPFLLASESSLQDLNTRLGQGNEISMLRFRPNIHIEGAAIAPWSEDKWKVVQIGSVVFDATKACSRCTLTTVDFDRGVKTEEPLRTLQTFRKRDKGVYFGLNLINRTGGAIRVGDKVTLLETWDDLIPI